MLFTLRHDIDSPLKLTLDVVAAALEVKAGSEFPCGTMIGRPTPGLVGYGGLFRSEMINKVRRAANEHRLLEPLLRRVAPGALRALQRPATGEIFQRTREWRQVLDAVAADWERYQAEYDAVELGLATRYQATHLTVPGEFAIESLTAKLLYLIVRARKPRTVLETGVANGHSTVVLLAALSCNGSGTLHSTDVVDDAGSLLTPNERQMWNYHRLRTAGDVRKQFAALAVHLAPID